MLSLYQAGLRGLDLLGDARLLLLGQGSLLSLAQLLHLALPLDALL